MYYVSTRNARDRRTAAEAIAQGLAADGGLMTPEVFPKLSHNALDTMRDMSYQQRAVYVMGSYLDDFTSSELSSFAAKAYGGSKFDVKEVAPVRQVDGNTYCLELWHGPTCAFKDMALQMLPHLLSASLVKNQEEKTVCILVATSATPARPPWRASGTWKRPGSWCSTPRTASPPFRSSRWPPRRGRTWGCALWWATSTTPDRREEALLR